MHVRKFQESFGLLHHKYYNNRSSLCTENKLPLEARQHIQSEISIFKNQTAWQAYVGHGQKQSIDFLGMAQEENAFRGSKDYREFLIDEATRKELRNQCSYDIKNEYYFVLSKPEHVHLVLLLALRKKNSKLPKDLESKFASLPDGEVATFKEYFINNQKRKDLIVPDAFQSIFQPLNYHQKLIEMHYKSFDENQIKRVINKESKGKLRIRYQNTLKYYSEGLNVKICENQDIFLMHLGANQLVLVCFSEKSRNEQNIKIGSSVLLSHESEIFPESQINEQKEKADIKVSKPSVPRRLQEQGQSEKKEDVQSEAKIQQSLDRYFTLFLLLFLIAVIMFVNPYQNSPFECLPRRQILEYITDFGVREDN